MGAAMVAGGLYACAVDGIEGDHLRPLDALATGPCMSQPDGLESVGTYKGRVEELARRGWIDPLQGLKGDRVSLFTGLADKVVNPETVHRAAQLYQRVEEIWLQPSGSGSKLTTSIAASVSVARTSMTSAAPSAVARATRRAEARARNSRGVPAPTSNRMIRPRL